MKLDRLRGMVLKYLEKYDLKEYQLAAMAGLSEGVVYNFLDGKDILASNLAAIMQVVNAKKTGVLSARQKGIID